MDKEINKTNEKMIYNWYIIAVRGGRKEKIIEEIKEKLRRNNKEKYVIDINEQKNLRGYILVHCYLTTELVKFFYGIERVIGFLDHQKYENKLPDFISDERFKTMLEESQKENNEKEEVENSFELSIGNLVKITTGTFADREGRITYLDKKKQKAKITIESSGWEIADVPTSICQKVLI